MIRVQLVIFVKTVLTVGFALCSHYLDFPESADALCTMYNNKVHLYLHRQESSAKILKATNTNQYQTSAKECQIIVKPERDHGVIAYVNRINLRTNKFHKCEDYVKLGYRGHSSNELCIKEGGQLITYDNGQPMIIEFFRKKAYGKNDSVYDHNFEIVLTQYSRAYEDGTFPCSNGRHIWEGLICDQKINCGRDNSDELCWNKTNIGSMVGAVIGGFLVIFVILGLCYCLRKRHLLLTQNSRQGSITTMYSSYSPTPLQSTVVVPVQDPNYSPLPQEYPPDHPFVFPLSGKDKV